MKIRTLLMAIGILTCAHVTGAQTTTTERVVTGQPVTMAVDMPDTTGATFQLRFYIDNVLQPNVVYGTPQGTTRTVQFSIPPFTVIGTKALRLGVIYTVVDMLKTDCPAGSTGTVSGTTKVCSEVSASNNISLTVAAPPTPLPPPTNFRIILTPSLGPNGDEVGFWMEVQEVIDGDAKTLQRSFVAAAIRRTGAFQSSFNLAPVPPLFEHQVR